MTPTVSIIMPCYNGAKTVRVALASIVAQTFTDWECIVVDDGSKDDTWKILEDARAKIGDQLVIHRLDRNRGRGTARQAALDRTRGRYLAMVDADDWVYPEKLATQLRYAERYPQAVAIGGTMSVYDDQFRLVGMHTQGVVPYATELGPWNDLRQPPIPHAPSLLDARLARARGFDLSLRTSEDTDFLLGLILGQRFVLIPEVVYAYSEPGSITLPKLLQSYSATGRIMRKHAARYPQAYLRERAKLAAKGAVQRVAYRLGVEDRILASHHRTPRPDEAAAYDAAWATVRRVCEQTFGTV
jgi:glycosyltransferase involved in cell wall biosynthesis